jgi:hypothetical protein
MVLRCLGRRQVSQILTGAQNCPLSTSQFSKLIIDWQRILALRAVMWLIASIVPSLWMTVEFRR